MVSTYHNIYFTFHQWKHLSINYHCKRRESHDNHNLHHVVDKVYSVELTPINNKEKNYYMSNRLKKLSNQNGSLQLLCKSLKNIKNVKKKTNSYLFLYTMKFETPTCILTTMALFIYPNIMKTYHTMWRFFVRSFHINSAGTLHPPLKNANKLVVRAPVYATH